MRISIKDVVGPNAMTLEDGSRVYDLIRPNLLDHRKIELSFVGVEVCASPFFNASISRLLAEFQADFLREHLLIVEISPVADKVLRRSLENAKTYYETSAADRQQIDQAIRKAAFS